MRLDRRIIIQTFTEAKDAYGESIKTWVTHATVWAKIEDKLTGLKTEESKEIVAVNIRFFWIRYLDTVVEKMRIFWKSEYYYIEVITEIGREKFMKLKVEKRDNE